MFTGVGNGVAVTALIAFINTVYARPWEQNERALLLPGIVGGMIGYAVGAWAREKGWLRWLTVIISAVLTLTLSAVYNEVLLHLPMKSGEYTYEVLFYGCFSLMNMAAFTVFGAIGWGLGVEGAKRREEE